MKYINKVNEFIGVCLILLCSPTLSIAASTDILETAEDWIEDQWVVDSIGEAGISISINGEITHGDRLRLRYDYGNCDEARVLVPVYTMIDSDEILSLHRKRTSIIIDDIQGTATILWPKRFLSGYRFTLDLGVFDANDIKTHSTNFRSMTVELVDSSFLKISDYVDLNRNTWSLEGLSRASDRAQATCRAKSGDPV